MERLWEKFKKSQYQISINDNFNVIEWVEDEKPVRLFAKNNISFIAGSYSYKNAMWIFLIST